MQQLTLVNFEKDEDCVISEFDCDFVVTCAGDSIWGDTSGRQVKVNGITIITNAYDSEVGVMVNVSHDSEWDIYTDSGFESAISDALGFAVTFTEQGMQEDFFASMEA